MSMIPIFSPCIILFCWENYEPLKKRNTMHFLFIANVSQHILSAVCLHAKSLQSCPTLCNPLDCDPPASSVQGILQARIPETGCHALLQENLPNAGMEPASLYLLPWQESSLPLAPPGNPSVCLVSPNLQTICFLETSTHQTTASVRLFLQRKQLMCII